MDFENRRQHLFALYEVFEREAEPYKREAVCVRGCASCCIHVGSVDCTTLEGMVIRSYLRSLSPATRKELNRRLRDNRAEKATHRFARCAFLDEDRSCRIYSVRPFSCRQLYSLRKCGESGPIVHRAANQMVERTIEGLRMLDPHGLSGHVSFVLHLLEKDGFRRSYLKGTWKPETHADLMRRYKLTPNTTDGPPIERPLNPHPC